MASVNKRRWTYNGQAKEAWVVRYFDEKGVHRSKTFAQKKAADAFKRQVEREIEDGTHVTRDQSLTVAAVCERFIEDLDRRLARGEVGHVHYRKQVRRIRRHILPEVGHIVFKAIRTEDVDKLHHVLSRKLSPVVVRQMLSVLSMIEKFAIRHRYMLASPVAAALAGIRPVDKPRIRELSIDQTMTLLRVSLQRRPRQKVRCHLMMACIIHLAACCGMRLGEILALPWSNIDWDAGTIHIGQSLTVLREIKGPKSKAGVRDVPVPEHLLAMLSEWKKAHSLCSPHDLVFTTMRGKLVEQRDVGRQWYDVMKDAGLFHETDRFHFHALRHFAGSWWLHKGMSIPDVSRLLGHATPAITMTVYAHSLSKPAEQRRFVVSNARELLGSSCARLTQQAA